MTIDDRLAFGEYVSLPIRTEKTAEEKWIELQKWLVKCDMDLKKKMNSALDVGMELTARTLDARRMQTAEVLIKMRDLST